jgi:hypothetical protein
MMYAFYLNIQTPFATHLFIAELIYRFAMNNYKDRGFPICTSVNDVISDIEYVFMLSNPRTQQCVC